MPEKEIARHSCIVSLLNTQIISNIVMGCLQQNDLIAAPII